MSDNNQDKPDDYEAIFAETPADSKRKEPSFSDADVSYVDITDVSASSVRDIDDGEGSVDDPDSEEGIFAPEQIKEKKAKSSSGLLGAVALLAVAGAGGYVYLTNPQLIEQVQQNVLGEELAADLSQATPDLPQGTDTVGTPVDSASAVTAPMTSPEISLNEGQGDAAAPQVVAVESPDVVEVPADAVSVESTSVVVPEAVPVRDTAQAEQVPQAEPQAVAIPVSEAEVVSVDEVPADVVSAVPAVVDAPAVPDVASVAAPVAAPTPVETPAVTAVEAPAPVAEVKTQNSDKPSEKVAKPSPDKEQVEVVDSKDDKKQAADAKLDQYFDSPSGKILKDIPAPSMNPKKGVGESIIIVEKSAAKKETHKKSSSGKKAPVSIETNDLDAKIIAAGRAVKLERYDTAREMYDELYRLNPRDGRILMGRAVLFQKMGETDRAISAYEEVLTQTPDNTEAIVNLAGLVRKQYPAVALGKLLDLQQKYPNNAVIAGQLGVAYADSGNFKDAYFSLSKAAALEPNNPQHFYNMAVVAERAGNVAVAIQNYEKSLEVDAVYGDSGRVISRERIYDRLARLRGN